MDEKFGHWVDAMNVIAEIRDYKYDLRVAYWSGDYPSFFREKHPLRIPNMRHDFITVHDFDKNPHNDNMGYLSAWGTGMGITYRGELGVVNNAAPYGSYFRPDGSRANRIFVGHKPHSGKFCSIIPDLV